MAKAASPGFIKGCEAGAVGFSLIPPTQTMLYVVVFLMLCVSDQLGWELPVATLSALWHLTSWVL